MKLAKSAGTPVLERRRHLHVSDRRVALRTEPLQSSGQVRLGISPFFRAAFYCQLLRLLNWNFTETWFAVNLAAALAFANLLPAVMGRRDVSFSFVVALFVSFTLNGGGGQDASIMLMVIVAALWLAARELRTSRSGFGSYSAEAFAVGAAPAGTVGMEALA